LVIERKPLRKRPGLLPYAAAACFLFTICGRAATAQETPQKPVSEPAARSTEKADKSEKPAHPSQIELLETKVRFEANGDSRKEVHALVKINSELGVRQFAQLNFDFNRSFESVEIPMVHITHASGGTADILPSAVADHPNPAVVNYPAYQDVRVKSVRILGLQPSDALEYRVIRTVSHHPLAPDFWLEHSFDRAGIVSREVFELDLPSARQMQIHINPKTPAESQEKSGSGDTERTTYKWDLDSSDSRKSEPSAAVVDPDPDVVITTFLSWGQLTARLRQRMNTWFTTSFWAESLKRIGAAREPVPVAQLYEFVSSKITTIDLPLDFALPFRGASEIFTSGYGRPEEKLELLYVLDGQNSPKHVSYCLYSRDNSAERKLPRPSLFSGMLLELEGPSGTLYLDPSLEVAPFGMIRADIRNKRALMLDRCKGDESSCWTTITNNLPFPSLQRVGVDATLNADGRLTAKVHYSMRGDNELILRAAFHHTPKERWKEVGQLLSITDGFRGQVTGVTASDPYATKDPFTVEYELDQAKFVDWSKKAVHIPALLPQLGLPDSPVKPASGSATAPIDLGTPLEVETKMTLHLPPGTSASAPAGTSVQRDYATYSSQYSANGSTLTATRRIKFVLREVPAAHAADYIAFLRAVQSDESQDFTLEPPANPVPKTN
jgi:uncharacterized protein DUF3857